MASFVPTRIEFGLTPGLAFAISAQRLSEPRNRAAIELRVSPLATTCSRGPAVAEVGEVGGVASAATTGAGVTAGTAAVGRTGGTPGAVAAGGAAGRLKARGGMTEAGAPPGPSVIRGGVAPVPDADAEGVDPETAPTAAGEVAEAAGAAPEEAPGASGSAIRGAGGFIVIEPGSRADDGFAAGSAAFPATFPAGEPGGLAGERVR
jgi:hypothetical protein